MSHSGSTAGYSAFLTRFPDERVSVAVLCNVATNATALAHEVSDVVFAGRLKPPVPPEAMHTLTNLEAARITGLYRAKLTGAPLTIALEDGRLTAARLGVLVPATGLHFVTALNQTWDFDGNGSARAEDEYGTVDTYERVAGARPSMHELEAYAGAYGSDEAEVDMTARVDAEGLLLKRRPVATIRLTPVYADAFRADSLGTVIFSRDAGGRPIGFRVVQDRVWSMPFHRVSDPG